MDLAIVTGRGPEQLTNINHCRPYVKVENVVHIGQRDQQETMKYHAMDIGATSMYCVDEDAIHSKDSNQIADDLLRHIDSLRDVNGFWLHFDTDVLSDSVNPAVDYRLAGGLSADEAQGLLGVLLNTRRVTGMSVTIYNPKLDIDGHAGRAITDILVNAFDSVRHV
jgi:arginase